MKTKSQIVWDHCAANGIEALDIRMTGYNVTLCPAHGEAEDRFELKGCNVCAAPAAYTQALMDEGKWKRSRGQS